MARRPGRKSNPNAQRRQNTRAGREAREVPSAAILARRLALAGDERTGLDFPPDVLLRLGLIDQDMHDEALRYAMLAWALFGFPEASCQGVYERMVAGLVGGDGAEGEETGEQRDRRAAQLKAYHKLTAYLQRVPGAYAAVRDATQFQRLPALVGRLRAQTPAAPADYLAMATLVSGLQALVRRTRRRAPAGEAAPEAYCSALRRDVGRQYRRAESRAAESGWLRGPLFLPPDQLERLRLYVRQLQRPRPGALADRLARR